MKAVFCTPALGKPLDPYFSSLEASIPLIKAAGWEEGYIPEVDNPYISAARATMTRKALDAGADVMVYLDYDLSWKPEDLLTLLNTPGDVVAGTYRNKIDEESYMGRVYSGPDGRPMVREDGCIRAELVPAGFLKVTAGAIDKFMQKFPELCYGKRYHLYVDLFNHGAWDGVWWGEDYAFSRRWREAGGDLWIVPNLDLTHWKKQKDGSLKPYAGNFHHFLCRQPGGSEHNPEEWANTPEGKLAEQ